MIKHPTPMLLKTQFDIDQVSDVLAWKFVRRDGHPEPDHGKDAGMINFIVGQAFHVQIEATSRCKFKGFDVLDCCLITRPFVYSCGPKQPTVYAPPSMFTSKLLGHVVPATLSLPGKDFEQVRFDLPEHVHKVVLEWTDHLTVGNFLGRWDMSFVLTVKIRLEDGTTSVRVFSFDPETDVGEGTIGEPEEDSRVCLMPETDPTSGSI